MKKFAFLVFALAILVTGMAAADRGVDPTPETQGVVIGTSISAIGNFDSSTDIQWASVDGVPGVFPVPPLAGTEAYYASWFTADTQSLGTGLIAYDRQTDVETSAQIIGQYNIESEMALGYVGVDVGRVTSAEQIMVDGAALPTQRTMRPVSTDEVGASGGGGEVWLPDEHRDRLLSAMAVHRRVSALVCR